MGNAKVHMCAPVMRRSVKFWILRLNSHFSFSLSPRVWPLPKFILHNSSFCHLLRMCSCQISFEYTCTCIHPQAFVLHKAVAKTQLVATPLSRALSNANVLSGYPAPSCRLLTRAKFRLLLVSHFVYVYSFCLFWRFVGHGVFSLVWRGIKKS